MQVQGAQRNASGNFTPYAPQHRSFGASLCLSACLSLLRTSFRTPGLRTVLPSSQNSTSTRRSSSHCKLMPPLSPSPPPEMLAMHQQQQDEAPPAVSSRHEQAENRRNTQVLLSVTHARGRHNKMASSPISRKLQTRGRQQARTFQSIRAQMSMLLYYLQQNQALVRRATQSLQPRHRETEGAKTHKVGSCVKHDVEGDDSPFAVSMREKRLHVVLDQSHVGVLPRQPMQPVAGR